MPRVADVDSDEMLLMPLVADVDSDAMLLMPRVADVSGIETLCNNILSLRKRVHV